MLAPDRVVPAAVLIVLDQQWQEWQIEHFYYYHW
jgi:hypothetical protein